MNWVTLNRMNEIALVVGESLVDVVHDRSGRVREYAGGSAANVAVALARLERPTWFATSFADDPRGRLLADHLARAGVSLAVDPAAVPRTAEAVARLQADGSASYSFDIEWDLNPLALPAAVTPVVVHACSLGAVLQPGADAVAGLVAGLRSTATVSYDINVRPGVTGTGPEVVTLVERLVALSDVVKASDEDLAALWPERSWRESAQALLALGPSAVMVTRGGAAAVAVTATAGEVVGVVRSVEVADTIGAGDTFGAATLDALWARGLVGSARRAALRDLDADGWRSVLAYAATAAAVTVSRPGADPPYRHELDRASRIGAHALNRTG